MTTGPGIGIPDRCSGPTWPWTAERRAQVRTWIRALRGFSTQADLIRSPFWRREGPALTALLAQLQGDPDPSPRITSPIADPPERWRAVHWNILKGIAFEPLVSALQSRPELRDADLLLLNEVDVGTVRSENRHVAAELAARLGLHWVYVPSYLEMTKGPGAEADLPGENEVGLHGVAILSRVVPQAVVSIPLPETFDYFPFSEKRLGQRRALAVSLPGGLVAVAVHLEVRLTPRHRALQMRALLEGVERFCAEEDAAGRSVAGVLLAGDFNTHTFARGTLWRQLGAFLRMAGTPHGRLEAQLREPWSASREPLFGELRARGYTWEALNDRTPTARAPLSTIEEAGPLPRRIRRTIRGWIHPDPRGLPLRLDWFAGRRVLPLGERTGRTVGELLDGPTPPSDHAPLVLDFRLGTEDPQRTT